MDIQTITVTPVSGYSLYANHSFTQNDVTYIHIFLISSSAFPTGTTQIATISPIPSAQIQLFGSVSDSSWNAKGAAYGYIDATYGKVFASSSVAVTGFMLLHGIFIPAKYRS